MAHRKTGCRRKNRFESIILARNQLQSVSITQKARPGAYYTHRAVVDSGTGFARRALFDGDGLDQALVVDQAVAISNV